jgi:hypothetical protein
LGDADTLTGEEVVLLIEALDALLPQKEENQRLMTDEERDRWAPYWMLRRRLKSAVQMSFYDSAHGWLENELRRERISLTDALHTRLAALLRDPAANRRSVRHGFVAAIQELREKRHSTRRPLSD